MPRKPSVPSYCLHKPSGQAYCRLNGTFIYLGEYGSDPSKQKFAALLAEYPTPESRRHFIAVDDDALTVAELVLRFADFCKGYFGETSERLIAIKQATKPLVALYGSLPVGEFSPKKLKAVREHIVATGNQQRQKQDAERVFKPLNRNYVNELIEMVKRIFRWGVQEEIVPVAVSQAIDTLDTLKKGRCENVRESRKVRPVAEAHIKATLPCLCRDVAAMVQVQRLTGARPDETTIMRPCDIDTSDVLWVYRPSAWKTSWHEGDDETVILIGKRAQAILKPYMAMTPPDDYLFKPVRAIREANSKRRKRLTRQPTFGSEVNAQPCYNDASYRRAVSRACIRAGVPVWTPNQLRHTRATEVDHKFDREASSLVLRHKNMQTTAIYAERNEKKYRAVVAKIG